MAYRGEEEDAARYRMYRAITGWLEKVYHLLNPDTEGERDVRSFSLKNKNEPPDDLLVVRGDIQLMIDLAVNPDYKQTMMWIKSVKNRQLDAYGRLPLSYEDFEDFITTTPEKDKFGLKIAGADLPEVIHGSPDRGRSKREPKKPLGDAILSEGPDEDEDQLR